MDDSRPPQRTPSAGSAQDRLRRAMIADVTKTAFGLFLEKGFDETTAGDISAAAGISRSTFFRYFATKEDVVVGSLVRFGGLMLQALQAQPEDADLWPALRQALNPMVDAQEAVEPLPGLQVARMIKQTPSLQARHLEKTISWQETLVPEVARRLGASDDASDPRAAALVAAALGSLNAATNAWVASDGSKSMHALLDEAMKSIK
jgi:AcrR family transcriptional regulator